MMKNTLYFLVALMLITFSSAKVTIVRTKTVSRYAKATHVPRHYDTTHGKVIEDDSDDEVLDVNIDPIDNDDSSSEEEITTTPKPKPNTTPKPKPTTTPKPKPTTTPKPKPTTTPKPKPTTTPKPKPTTTPKPKPTTTPKPKPTTTPKPKPTTTPKPKPTTTPKPKPTTTPKPKPTTTPKPKPTTTPKPKPTTTTTTTTTITTIPRPTTTTTTKVPTTTTTTTTTVVPVPTECVTEVFGIATDFNGFFFGDFVGTNSDVQGRLAAKGNIDISGGYQNGAFNFDPVNHATQSNYDCTDAKVTGSVLYSIVAGGSVNYRDHGEILNGGVAYGNDISLPQYIQEALGRRHCPIDKKRIIDFDKEKVKLTTLSKNLGSVSQNAKLTNEYGKLVIDLVPGQKLYTINADQISQYWDIEVRDNGVNTDEIAIVLNFTGSSIVLKDFNVSSLNKYATKTIWNAPNAKNIKIENFRVQGSLLAPNADIEGTNANIQGQMIANNFKGNLQIDWVPFLGCIDIN